MLDRHTAKQLQDAIGREVEARREFLASGKSSSHEETRYEVGRIKGLRDAIEAINAYIKEQDRDA